MTTLERQETQWLRSLDAKWLSETCKQIARENSLWLSCAITGETYGHVTSDTTARAGLLFPGQCTEQEARAILQDAAKKL